MSEKEVKMDFGSRCVTSSYPSKPAEPSGGQRRKGRQERACRWALESRRDQGGQGSQRAGRRSSETELLQNGNGTLITALERLGNARVEAIVSVHDGCHLYCTCNCSSSCLSQPIISKQSNSYRIPLFFFFSFFFESRQSCTDNPNVVQA